MTTQHLPCCNASRELHFSGSGGSSSTAAASLPAEMRLVHAAHQSLHLRRRPEAIHRVRCLACRRFRSSSALRLICFLRGCCCCCWRLSCCWRFRHGSTNLLAKVPVCLLLRHWPLALALVLLTLLLWLPCLLLLFLLFWLPLLPPLSSLLLACSPGLPLPPLLLPLLPLLPPRSAGHWQWVACRICVLLLVMLRWRLLVALLPLPLPDGGRGPRCCLGAWRSCRCRRRRRCRCHSSR